MKIPALDLQHPGHPLRPPICHVPAENPRRRMPHRNPRHALQLTMPAPVRQIIKRLQPPPPIRIPLLPIMKNRCDVRRKIDDPQLILHANPPHLRVQRNLQFDAQLPPNQNPPQRFRLRRHPQEHLPLHPRPTFPHLPRLKRHIILPPRPKTRPTPKPHPNHNRQVPVLQHQSSLISSTTNDYQPIPPYPHTRILVNPHTIKNKTSPHHPGSHLKHSSFFLHLLLSVPPCLRSRIFTITQTRYLTQNHNLPILQ